MLPRGKVSTSLDEVVKPFHVGKSIVSLPDSGLRSSDFFPFSR
jgi:hypothetical protein